MSRTSGRRAGETDRGAERASLYDEVTGRIVAELEAGRFPWVRPWDAAAAAPVLPRNAVSHHAYSGINVLILWGEVIARGYASQGWLTFRRALDAGGCVRKGEHGVGVVYADRFTPEAEKERAAIEGDAARAVPFLKRFTVFNVEQCDGLPEHMLAGAAPLPERELAPPIHLWPSLQTRCRGSHGVCDHQSVRRGGRPHLLRTLRHGDGAGPCRFVHTVKVSLGDLLSERTDVFAQVIVLELGKPLNRAHGARQICISIARHYAEKAKTCAK